MQLAAVVNQKIEPAVAVSPLIEPGGDFRQTMYVVGPRQGRLLWRLVSAEGEHAPRQLTPEIRDQVVRDLKIQAGMQRKLGDDFKIILREVREVEKTARGKHRWLVSRLTS